MSLYSEDPEFKKAMIAIAKDMAEYVKKRYEEFMGEQISKWVAEELKKMGYPKKKEK